MDWARGLFESLFFLVSDLMAMKGKIEIGLDRASSEMMWLAIDYSSNEKQGVGESDAGLIIEIS